MQIQANKLIFPTHVVVCELGCYSAEYMEDMAYCLATEARSETPREHARVLRHNNNDGTWGIKMLDTQ
jgi:hypothetical protein